MTRKCKFYSECHSDAVYKIPHANLFLCKKHFIENVEKRVKTFIEKKHLFHPWNPPYTKKREKILIALSGGKDSQVLLHILKKLYPEEHIEALYIELGIAPRNYSSDSLKVARRTCSKLGVPLHVVHLKDMYGFGIDDIAYLIDYFHENDLSLGRANFRGICSYCGTFKRHVLNKFAYEHGFTCVATGHNMTDETTSLVVNFFNQSLLFLAKMDFKSDSGEEKLVPRIKPLYYISEEEIIMYAYYANIEHLPTECIHSEKAKTLQIKDVLNEIESYRTGTMISLMRRYQKVLKPILKEYVETHALKKSKQHLCPSCGFPTFSKRCYHCRTVNFLKDRFKQINYDPSSQPNTFFPIGQQGDEEKEKS